VNKLYRFTGTAVAALTLAASAAAFSASQAAAQPTVAHRAAAAAAKAIAPPAPHPMIPAALPPGAAGNATIDNTRTVGSTNWDGYAVTKSGGKFRAVSATFFVPFLNCAVSPGGTNGTFSSDWVGLDGFSSTTVEQDGIEADCNGSSAQYFAWHEIFPKVAVASKIAIHPGDSITASVRFNSSTRKYRMEVSDSTDGKSFTVRQACAGSACKRTSAEVISEAPSLVVGGSLVQASMSDYGAVGFTGISITGGSGQTGGIKSSHWSRVRIEQLGITSHNAIAHPTALHGASFSNYWLGEN